MKQRLHDVDTEGLWQYRLPAVAAKESELVKAEQHLGEPLDRSHREFLSCANGWPAFYQTVDLFGVDDLLGGPRFSRAMEMLCAVEDHILAERGLTRDLVLPIASSPVDLDMAVIARRGAKTPGTVLWLAGYVVDQFDDFDEYFAAMVDYNRLEVEELQKKGP